MPTPKDKKSAITEVRRTINSAKAPPCKRPSRKKKPNIGGESEYGDESLQMDMFKTFLANPIDRDKLSNSIDLWDSLPKYSFTRKRMDEERSSDGKLKELELSCHCNNKEYTLTIHPASIKEENGVFKSYYPSAAEEIVEEALRKIAADQSGFLNKGKYESGVVFSIYMLQKELAERGHQRRHADIVKSLRILALSKLEIACRDDKNKAFSISSFLPSLTMVSRDDLKENPESRCIAQFHPLVTQSILEITYRQFDYYRLMGYRKQLTRWLSRYLIHKFTFASMAKTFMIHYKTIKRDSNLLNYQRERKNVEELDQSLLELVEFKVLLAIHKEVIVGSYGRIDNVIYTLTPHPNFVGEVKAANKRILEAREKVIAHEAKHTGTVKGQAQLELEKLKE